MGLQADVYQDMLISTLKHLGRFKWTDLTTSRHNFIALPKILNNSKAVTRTGIGVQFQVKVGTVGTARNVYIGHTTNYRTADTMKSASVPWRHMNTSYMFYRKTMAMNKDPELIFDMVKSERHGAFMDRAEVHEQNFWTKPADSTDDIKPFGLPYWVVFNSTLGQTGGNASGFTAGPGGLDSDAYPRWKNWSGPFSAVTKPDFIRTIKYLLTKTKYKPPIAPQPDYSTGASRGIYAGYDRVLAPLGELLEAQNDNLSRTDLDGLYMEDSQVMIRRYPIEWCDYLDDDTNDPVYGVDWAQYQPIFLSGENAREDGPKEVSGQIGVFAVDIDDSMNYICENRRTQFVMQKV